VHPASPRETCYGNRKAICLHWQGLASEQAVNRRALVTFNLCDQCQVGRDANEVYRVREHLTEDEVAKLLAALKRNRHGHRDWLIARQCRRSRSRISGEKFSRKRFHFDFATKKPTPGASTPGPSRPISAISRSSIRCVIPSWRLPASRACFGIEDKNSLDL
jgi:hypothetical protein